MRFKPLLLAVILLWAANAVAATFVMPTDEELVTKSDAIVLGIVEGSFVQEAGGTIETVYEIRPTRTLKGTPGPPELIRVVAMGGIVGGRGLLVPGEAHYRQGERVLVFLTRDDGRWRTTDLTLGRFKSVTSTAGAQVLVRDMEDVVGWDHAGRPHREKVRREAGFLQFIEERMRGRKPVVNYVVDASEVTLQTSDERLTMEANATSYPPATYTDFVNNQPIRWPNMSAGVKVYKRSDQNMPSTSDGGVAAIQSGLGAWNNECGSTVNLVYSGQIAKASANHDATNVVEYNDPQSRISGSWSGSGTVGVTFLSFSGSHTFTSQSWLNITDFDVVFQNGYTGSNSSFPPAMVHEVGHGIGFRHSNQNHATGGACNSSVEECTSAAIMNSSVSGSYGYNLQPYDVNAVQSVYPGGSCGTPPPACTAPAITAQPTSRTIAAGSSTTLSVSASGTAPLTYQWYVGSSGNTSTPIPGQTGASLITTPTSTTTYWVRVSNSCGTANSQTVTVTVSAATPPPPSGAPTRTLANGRYFNSGATGWRSVGMGDFNGDGRQDVLFRDTATGRLQVWYMNATTVLGSANLPHSTDINWQVTAVADFNGDAKPDLLFNHAATGYNVIWVMNGTAFVRQDRLPSSGPDWRVVGAGDFNGDGDPDVLYQHKNAGNFVVWYLNGTAFSAQVRPGATATGTWRASAVGDLNRDGSADIIFRNTATGQNLVWYMNGILVSQQLFLSTVSDLNWIITSAGDASGDGRVDLLWQNPATTENAYWYMNGTTVL